MIENLIFTDELQTWDLEMCKEMVSAIDIDVDNLLNKKLISEKKRDEIFDDFVTKREMLIKKIKTLEN